MRKNDENSHRFLLGINLKKIGKLALLGVLILNSLAISPNVLTFLYLKRAQHSVSADHLFFLYYTVYTNPFSCPCVEGRKLRVSARAFDQ